MARVDTNIFRDLSTTKASVPSDEAIHSELKNIDIKILRLRSAAYWVDYVALSPAEPEWHQKQQAILNCDNPTDSLLRQGFNFLDVNDLATVNRINEDNAHLHISNVHKLAKRNPHECMQKKVVQSSLQETQDKYMNIDTMPAKSSQNMAGKIAAHLLRAVQDVTDEQETDSDGLKEDPLSKMNTFQSLPQHLLQAYYTLRFIASRDAKTRILYNLNYFRSVQKRLALDLREFATRDRVDAHQVNPFVQSKEANHNVVNQVSFAAKAFDKISQKSTTNSDNTCLFKNMSVFDEQAIQQIQNMASLRNYKCNGMFSNKVFSTCPSYPKFHAAHGEPVQRMTVDEEMDRQGSKSLAQSSIKLMGRIEFVEINEKLQEVYVKDDFGIYIMYDCTLQDMKCLEDELCKIGSYFLHKGEVLLDPSSAPQKQRPLPSRDRLELINDLLKKEAEFQFHKVKLTQVYMECYEHITDSLEQQKIMQIITDIMSRRPRLNLNANYFIDAYDAEIQCLTKQFELVKLLVDTQVTLEKTENQRLQGSLTLSYQLANTYTQNKWQYQDAETLLGVIAKKRGISKQVTKKHSSHNSIHSKDLKESTGSSVINAKPSERDDTPQLDDHIPDSAKHSRKDTSQILMDNISDSHTESEPSQYGQDDENKFTQLLGLPQITLESIYQGYREKDLNVIKLMAEHSHFIALHEGYPEFLTRTTNRSLMDKQKNFKPNYWSQDTGSLHFYETLDFITKYYATSQQMQQELYDTLKMWDTTLMTQIDIQVAEYSLQEFRKVLKYQDGSETEYEGRHYVEDEQIMGQPDKMIFYAKEMLADLNFKPKHMLDPFLVGKLNLETMKYFNFPKVPQSKNKYTMRTNGIAGLDYLLETEKLAIVGVAKAKVDNGMDQGVEDLIAGNVNDVLNIRNITVPSLLKTQCNMMELHRLRNEIILAASETAILSQVYQSQCAAAGQKTTKLSASEGISFDPYESVDGDQKLVNFLDHGCAHELDIDLAIREFDPILMSNFNFRNPDSFKLNVLTSGLEEVRAILQYQLFQKHLLIVATRINSLIIDTSVRAMTELSLIEKKKITIPNSIIRYNKIMNRNFDTINAGAIKVEQSHYRHNLSSTCQPVLYQVLGKKNNQRTSIAKEFSNYQTSVIQAMPHHDNSVLRVMRCFKLKLLTRFVQNTLTEVYLDAQKVQSVHSCQRLRYFNRYFKFDPKNLGMTDEAQVVLKYETSDMLENFPSNYLPVQFMTKDDCDSLQKKPEVLKFISQPDYKILDYSGIPSTSTLMMMDSSPIDDVRAFKKKRFEVREKVWGANLAEKDELKDIDPVKDEPEFQLKRLLPTFTPDEGGPDQAKKTPEEIDKKLGQSGGGLLDYEEALYFGDSKYAQLSRFYVSLERILTVEWFILKLQFRSDEVINIDNAIECGQLFWSLDEFDQRVQDALPQVDKKDQINKRAQSYFANQIVGLRQKRNIAEQLCSLSLTLKSFIAQVVKTKPEQRFEYISSYTEFRYQQVIGCMHKLVQQFSIQKKMPAVQTLRRALGSITKMNHVNVAFLKPGNYSVQTSVAAPDMYSLESSNLIHGSVQHEDILNFRRCVQPIVNEKALEPPQVSLFQSLYNHDYLRRSFTTQFAGQFCSSANSIPFKALDYSLLMLEPKERSYSQSFIVQAKYQANDFMETVFNDTTMASLTTEEVYNLRQLVDAKKFINESTQALLLRNSLICWFENSPMPDSAQQYEKFEENFRQNFFWKQMEQKEDLTRKLNMMSTFGSIPTHKELQALSKKIDDLVNDHSLATQTDVQKRDTLVKHLREEFASLKKKVTLDNYFNTKAEIQVFSNEIEKFLIRASVKTLDAECASLSKCFVLQVPSVQYHIHPFQQFAATFFDQVDPHSHLCISNKINAVQAFLTKMRNRSTQVETLTSGPGMVFTIKDINDIMLDFCRTIVKDQEKQFKSRTETSFLQQQQYQQLLYVKEQKIKTLENRLDRIGVNLENVIDARLFEKGNQLIYELDSSNRVLNIFKNAMYDLERSLASRIHGEQLEKFSRKNNELSLKDIKFDKYKETIMNMINADFAEDQERIKKLIKLKAENAKNTDQDAGYKKVSLYPIASGQATTAIDTAQQKSSKDSAQPITSLLTGAIVPKGFEHYSYCSCYKPSPEHPTPTLELAELEMLSEQDARRELSRMCTLLRKQRILHMTKDMATQSKYQNKINHLKKQLTNNTYLWDQLAESEKREKVMKQELLYTQQSLSAAEKTIFALKEDIKVVDAERSRLLNFKTSRVEKFKELEIKVHKYDLMDNIDTDALIGALTKQELKLKATEGLSQKWNTKIEMTEQKAATVQKNLERKVFNEQAKTQQVVEKMEQMKLELKMLETNDSSVASIWKKKCLDLFEVCQAMKNENDELRDRCKELIQQGLDLAGTIDGSNEIGSGELMPRDQFRSSLQTQNLLHQYNQSMKAPYSVETTSPQNETRTHMYSTIQSGATRSSAGRTGTTAVMTPQPMTPVGQLPNVDQVYMKQKLIGGEALTGGATIDSHLAQLGFKTMKPQSNQRGRTSEIDTPNNMSTKQNLQQRQDIKSILSGDSNLQTISRATKTGDLKETHHRRQQSVGSQNSKSQLTSSQIQGQNAIRRRQNYINQLQVPQTQDSIFNQSQATNMPPHNGTRNIVTADHNLIGKDQSVRVGGQRSKPISFDLQGKSLNQNALPTSPKPTVSSNEGRQSSSGYQRKSNLSTQKSLNLNVQRIQTLKQNQDDQQSLLIGQQMMSPIAQQTTDLYLSSQRKPSELNTATKQSKQSITSNVYQRQPLAMGGIEAQSSNELSVEK